MKLPLRKRWLVILVTVGLVAGCVASLDEPATIAFYRVIDEHTLGVQALTGAGCWVRIAGVDEAPSSVTVHARDLCIPGPRTAAAYLVDLTVTLRSPLGDRAVLDGRSGDAVLPALSPWPAVVEESS